MQNIVTLIVPAKEKELSVVRLTTAGIASRFLMDWETMEDVKTAVYEACYAMSTQRKSYDSLRLSFSLENEFSVTVTGEGEVRETEGNLPDQALYRAVLEEMIPGVSIEMCGESIRSIHLSR